MFQSTLKLAVSFGGIGIHSGNRCCVFVSPAPEDAGIIFHRKKDRIPASYGNVLETTMCTILAGTHGANVATVEHLSAAMYGLGITNAVITVEGDEIPILDGSALPFVKAFVASGIEKQQKKFRILNVLKTVKVQEGEKWASIGPSDSFRINVECDFSVKGLKTTPCEFDFSSGDFANEISPARTFGFFSDVEFLRKNHLALGASLDNTIVFDNNGCSINEDGLRLPNEPIRHKVLDVIGDLSLAQCNIKARFDSFCPSHKINNVILRALFEKSDNYEILE